MERPSFKWMTAARVMGLDWTRGWPRVLTEYQVAQLQAMSDTKDIDTFDMDVMRWKHKLRMAEMASVAEPCIVAKMATDDGLPPIHFGMYTAEEFLKCCQWVGVEPSPYAQEWIDCGCQPQTTDPVQIPDANDLSTRLSTNEDAPGTDTLETREVREDRRRKDFLGLGGEYQLDPDTSARNKNEYKLSINGRGKRGAMERLVEQESVRKTVRKGRKEIQQDILRSALREIEKKTGLK